ncbi:MAG: aspartate aminotransferase family protein [Acidobacteriota bacterium]
MKLYKRVPIRLVSGKGSRVKDAEGREYIDVLAGIAVNSLGHCHPAVVEAVREQAGRLIHCSNFYATEPQAKLAELLVTQSGLGKIFFCNSGAEAAEGALKLARKWGSKNGRGGGVITMDGSFHGRTLATIMATGQPKYRDGFDPLPSGFQTVPFNDLEAVKKAVTKDTCAVMVEPVQGEGGVRPASREYLEGLRRFCDEAGILLIFDEVQCGMGRTGFLFAYQGYGVTPDIVTLAKALGGGVPIGAVLARESVAEVFQPGNHGTTFGGNPLATAAARAAVTALIEEKLPERAREMGDYLVSSLQEATRGMEVIADIRGRGLMVGVELTIDGKPVVEKMLEKGVLGNCTAGKVMRFVPPLNISKADLDEVVRVFVESLRETIDG